MDEFIESNIENADPLLAADTPKKVLDATVNDSLHEQFSTKDDDNYETPATRADLKQLLKNVRMMSPELGDMDPSVPSSSVNFLRAMRELLFLLGIQYVFIDPSVYHSQIHAELACAFRMFTVSELISAGALKTIAMLSNRRACKVSVAFLVLSGVCLLVTNHVYSTVFSVPPVDVDPYKDGASSLTSVFVNFTYYLSYIPMLILTLWFVGWIPSMFTGGKGIQRLYMFFVYLAMLFQYRMIESYLEFSMRKYQYTHTRPFSVFIFNVGFQLFCLTRLWDMFSLSKILEANPLMGRSTQVFKKDVQFYISSTTGCRIAGLVLVVASYAIYAPFSLVPFIWNTLVPRSALAILLALLVTYTFLRMKSLIVNWEGNTELQLRMFVAEVLAEERDGKLFRAVARPSCISVLGFTALSWVSLSVFRILSYFSPLSQRSADAIFAPTMSSILLSLAGGSILLAFSSLKSVQIGTRLYRFGDGFYIFFLPICYVTFFFCASPVYQQSKLEGLDVRNPSDGYAVYSSILAGSDIVSQDNGLPQVVRYVILLPVLFAVLMTVVRIPYRIVVSASRYSLAFNMCDFVIVCTAAHVWYCSYTYLACHLARFWNTDQSISAALLISGISIMFTTLWIWVLVADGVWKIITDDQCESEYQEDSIFLRQPRFLLHLSAVLIGIGGIPYVFSAISTSAWTIWGLQWSEALAGGFFMVCIALNVMDFVEAQMGATAATSVGVLFIAFLTRNSESHSSEALVPCFQ